MSSPPTEPGSSANGPWVYWARSGYLLPYTRKLFSPATGLYSPSCRALTSFSHAKFFEAVWNVVSPTNLLWVGLSMMLCPLRIDAGGRGHGWTKEPKPRSSRIDSISQKATLGVKTSAAARTPVYAAVTGAAPASATASRYPFTAAHEFTP